MSKMTVEDGNILIFKNKSRTKDSQPGYTGVACVDGQQLEVALWVKDGQKGPFFAGQIKPPRERSESKSEPEPKPSANFDDDIPF